MLPVRHFFHSVNLWTLKLVFPNAWDSREFSVGACQAYECIASLMDESDFHSMHGLVSEDLLAALEEDQKDYITSVPGVQRKVLECQFRGIVDLSAKNDENQDAALFVSALLDTLEAHRVSDEDRSPWHVRRLHKWTFKRVLASVEGDEHSDWQVVAMNRKKWRPSTLMKPS
eukprot:gnl/MRDRNA2_/MRDRNA2_251852_c0_seq1.p1 gnl/MRDRNA2_/MRDRNA2_251852_c0~~gnl/MRDRNA2_/MRDRNA2_251852_c0_seq1.p1  ORF type:complete len:172 (-),score=19.38 gnl/MRDRNA2_/MRDRNA2_251852_c0_seq1:7-522(-)